MNNTSKSLSKIRKLITVLRKCNGKSVVGDKNALISPRTARILMYTGLLILAVSISLTVYNNTRPTALSYAIVNASDLKEQQMYRGLAHYTTSDSEVLAYEIIGERVKAASIEEAICDQTFNASLIIGYKS